jgi:hypothetical protein
MFSPAENCRPVAATVKNIRTRSLHPFHRDYIVPEPLERQFVRLHRRRTRFISDHFRGGSTSRENVDGNLGVRMGRSLVTHSKVLKSSLDEPEGARG